MNIVQQFKNYGWVAAGSISGIIAGATVNLLESRLLLGEKSASHNFINDCGAFSAINRLRESDLSFLRKCLFFPTPFSWFYPAVHVVPMLGYSIYNMCTKKAGDEKEQEIDLFPKKCWSQISKNVIYPSLHTTMLTISSIFARDVLCGKILPQSIDVSGHAIVQGALTIHAINSLQAIGETGTANQKKVHAVISAITSLSDAIWMYKTTTKHHTVADMVIGVALVSLVHCGIQVSKELINERFDLKRLKSCLF